MKNKPILNFLNTLLESIESGKINTKYSHSTKITSNHIETDCSGFVSYVLSQTGRNNALQEILDYKRKSQKTAQDWNKIFVRNFVYFLENSISEHWKVLSNPDLVNCGDIIFSVDSPVPNKGNNHCMFIIDIIKIAENKYELSVIDSTKTFFHFNDTRNAPGIGCGKIVIEKCTDSENWRCDFSPNFTGLYKKLVFARVL